MGAMEADLYDRDSFLRHIRKASQEVKKWPEWKEKMLGEVIPVQQENLEHPSFKQQEKSKAM